MRTIVTREPEWDAEQRAWVLGLAMREAAECRRCGGLLTETTDYGWSWQPKPPVACLRCVALAVDEHNHKDSPYRAGLIHRVEKRVRLTPQGRKRRRKQDDEEGS